MQVEFFRYPFYRKRRVRIHASEPFATRALDPLFQRFRVPEFRQKTVKKAFGPHFPETSGFSTICFISKIEIIGSRRTNTKNSITKRPIVPTYVAQSQIVG